jgi:hypothetical protein
LFLSSGRKKVIKEELMNRQFEIENAGARERLRHLADSLTKEELTLILNKEGWTVAAALAHLAFWDQRRLILVLKWKQKGVSPSPLEEHTINDALVPFFLEIPPRKAADLAVSIAGELDRELEASSPDFVDELEKTGDRHALNRAVHRKIHLDEIGAMLQDKRRKA